jgi:hypothetical protein
MPLFSGSGMLTASNLARIWRSLLDCSLSYATFLWVWHAVSLQMDKDKEILAELLSYTLTVLWVWYAGSLQLYEEKEVPGKVFSYLYRCPQGLVC